MEKVATAQVNADHAFVEMCAAEGIYLVLDFGCGLQLPYEILGSLENSDILLCFSWGKQPGCILHDEVGFVGVEPAATVNTASGWNILHFYGLHRPVV